MNLQQLCTLCLVATVHGDPIVSKPDSNLHYLTSNATEGQFPYQISLRVHGSHICGGTIVSSSWILTAAHCANNYYPSELSVLVGTTTLSSGGSIHNVSRIKVHEDYDSLFIQNDVAVLMLAESITYSRNVRPIPLEIEYLNSVDCIISGWGLTSYMGNTPNELKFLEVKSISLVECRQQWERFGDIFTEVFDTEICTFTRFGEGVCQGDSGSPLVANGKQIGIVSWGRACAVGVPDVFTRISSYYDWIQNAISE